MDIFLKRLALQTCHERFRIWDTEVAFGTYGFQKLIKIDSKNCIAAILLTNANNTIDKLKDILDLIQRKIF